MKIGFAALAALALTAPAFASEHNPLAAEKVVLDLKGLDLASVDGQQRLAIRIDQAARAVCGDRVATIHLDMEDQARSCRQDVVADIRSRIEQRTASAADLRSNVGAALN
ncbi:UrcA family protein [Sphingomonas vulcanisoli]|uniref:UrcA family protein n=1 Tax=Sphingomonas vulcanisoli TaxID=1658060 RepID=A0ABX0TMC8_9SPHN|nr:UrcA family protein [Sphingomonas vulcanisoli]NIJ06662.1 UrcA family protein [Sphingomonas vulcanisoli]